MKYWEKTKIYCKLEMIDPDKIIRVRPMTYSQEDIEDFCETLENPNFLRKGKTIILIKKSEFF